MIDRRVARAAQIVVLLCADTAVAAIVLLQARGREPMFDLLAAGAVAGMIICAVALAALLARNHGAAGTALVLAWLRLAGVPLAAGIIALRSGADAVIGLVETFVLAVAVLDAIAGLTAAVAASRATRG